MEFIIGASASMGAACFTNPLEVCKVRMQLQGELQKKGQHTIHYRNVFHAANNIVKNDGILALQKGLVSALGVQLILNGTRLGIFQTAENRGYIKDKNGRVIFHKIIMWGALSGCLGQFLSSPLFLIKTHFQAEASASIAVGHQHHHKGVIKAFKNIYINYGIRGLYRGATASIPRTGVGSIFQLGSFEYVKQHLLQNKFYQTRPILTAFVASMAGGIVLSIAITPFDLIMIRLYNQPIDSNGKGKLYKNYFDCLSKVYKTEGITAFYKGLGPTYLRLGPHTVISLIFWEKLKSTHEKFKNSNKLQIM